MSRKRKVPPGRLDGPCGRPPENWHATLGMTGLALRMVFENFKGLTGADVDDVDDVDERSASVAPVSEGEKGAWVCGPQARGWFREVNRVCSMDATGTPPGVSLRSTPMNLKMVERTPHPGLSMNRGLETCEPAVPSHGKPVWQPATQQVWQPAPRLRRQNGSWSVSRSGGQGNFP